MKKLFTLLALTLLCAVGVKAANVTLFTTNFSKADGWTTESIITETNTSASRTIKGTTISFAGYKSSALTVKVNDNDASASGTLTFTGNNISASNGEVNYYMAIPLSGVNESITVTTTGDLNGKSLEISGTKPNKDASPEGTITITDGKVTVSGLKFGDYTCEVGASEKANCTKN